MLYFYVICLAFTVFISVPILFKRKKELHEKLFLFWLLIIALTELSYVLLAQGKFKEYHAFFMLVFGVQMLHGPLFYMYSVSLLNKNYRFTYWSLLHLVPISVYYFSHFPIWFSGNTHGEMLCIHSYGCFVKNKSCSRSHAIFKLIVDGFYFAATYLHLFKSGLLKHSTNRKTQLKIKWFNIVFALIVGFYVIHLPVALISFYSNSGLIGDAYNFMLVNNISTIAVILFLFIWQNRHAILEIQFKLKSTITHSVSSVEMREKKDYVFLNEKIQSDKLYLNSNLNLRDLKNESGFSEHYISYLINKFSAYNFNEFVNHFRVNHFLEISSQDAYKEFSILGLAFESGLNSKTTFNRCFKEFTGKTPSEYIKSVKN